MNKLINTFIIAIFTTISLTAQESVDTIFDQLNPEFNYHDTIRVKLLLKASNAYLKLSDYEKERYYAKKALDLIADLEDKSLYSNSTNSTILKKLKGKALWYFGYSHFVVGMIEPALQYVDSAILILSSIQAKEDLANAQLAKGEIYREVASKTKESLQVYYKALNAFLDLDNKEKLCETYYLIARSFLILESYDQAMGYVMKAKKISDEYGITNINNYSYDYYNRMIGDIYFGLEKYDKAEKYYRKYLINTKKTDRRHALAHAINNIGTIYEVKGNLDEARNKYIEALKIRHDINDRYCVAASYNNLGKIMAKQNHLDSTILYFKKALSIRRDIKDARGMAETFYNYGKFSFKKNEYEKTKSFLDSAILFCNRIGIKKTKAKCYKLLSNLYNNLNNFELAYFYLKKYSELNDSIDITSKEVNIEGQLMQTNFERKQEQLKAEQKRKEALAQAEIRRQKLIRNSAGIGLLSVAIIAFLIYRQRNRLSKEKERSEVLLLNILPSQIATELKEKGRVKPKYFENVTVLFTDFVNFTHAGKEMTAEKLIGELHECFKAFDEIISRNGLEKIKTVGDAYIAVSGLPSPIEDHAERVVKSALEIKQFMTERQANLNYNTFMIRIGIHSGPVVAGIVGVNKFQYDIWGDTVNTAARMESAGENGKVNISQETYRQIKDGSEYEFEYRGKIKAKGKGKIDMYFVDTKY